VHAVLLRHGKPCPVTDLFGVRGRQLLSRLGLPDTIAAEIADIGRFPTPRKLTGYSGLCPRVYQSGGRELRGPLAKQGPRYLRCAP
jgi:transposase